MVITRVPVHDKAIYFMPVQDTLQAHGVFDSMAERPQQPEIRVYSREVLDPTHYANHMSPAFEAVDENTP